MRGSPGKSARAEDLFARVAALVSGPTWLMEVCGTHTMAIGRSGLRSRMPRDLHLVSGPGCPVCVTPASSIDRLIAMAREPGVTVLTFGDMMRVPGSTSSLDMARADGCDVKVVHSPATALAMAKDVPGRLHVFLGIGFETTSPTIAATVERAALEGTTNFLVLPAFKLVPPAMTALVESGESRIDGFICPGHVSAIIGTVPYERIASRGVPCVVTGFEPTDILEGIIMLLEQKADGRAEVEIQYRRVVTRDGNPVAMRVLERVLARCDAHWRGIGTIPGSGLGLAPEFARADAARRIPVEVPQVPDLPEGCACGRVMKGLVTPTGCPLFGKACRPESPVGPCMVSSEGACAAYYRYEAMRA